MYKVLLVDDEILVRKAIGKKLEWNQLGFELVGDCENGKDAIEFVKQHPVDVVSIVRRRRSLFSAVTVILSTRSRRSSTR